MKKIILRIAGFDILFILKGEQERYFQTAFSQMLINEHKDFATTKTKKTHFTINVLPVYQSKVIVKRSEEGRKEIYFLEYTIDDKRKVVSTNYSLSQARLEAMLRQIITGRLLPKNKGLFLHGSASSFGRHAYLFIGKAGSGKSTVVELLNGLGNILSDDSVIVRKMKDGFCYFQSPFYEKNWNFKRTNRPFPIGIIFFIKKAKFFKIEKINDKEYILENMLKQLFVEKGGIRNQFPQLVELVDRADFYKLYFEKDGNRFKKFFKEKILT